MPLTSQALLVSSINTVKFFKLARRTKLSMNGCKEYPHPVSALRPQDKIVEYLLEQDQREAAVCFERSASALHQQGSPVVTQRKHIVPRVTTSSAYIFCFGQVKLSICIVISRIPLERLAMGRHDGPSATHQMGMIRTLGDVTHTLNSCS